MTIKEILNKLSFSEDLSQVEAEIAMNLIMTGEVNSEQVAAFLTAMRLKGETIDELTAFVRVMREQSIKVNVNVDGAVDLVGTGGDKSGTFNISTISSIIVAGAGVPVIKHGNRSASSKCGSADVLAKLGAKIELDNKAVERVFNEVGMAFMFAPMFHPAMKYVMPARRALGFRTFFNILGPMSNPAGVKRYVIGAFSKEVASKMVSILANLDTEFAYTFNSHDGLDELSTTAHAEVFELKDSVVSRAITFDAQSIGFQKVGMDELMGGEPDVNAEIFNNILDNKATRAQKEIILLNATFAIQASGKVESLVEAKELATDCLESSKARKLFDQFVEATNSVGA
ncbi:MAG: anthranilate phosphoribosyltransferase [Balneolaceae bacterium]|nr:anthranilate phosphoribosyltransferase [Balneolaceae bacterium]MBO6547484.1 anthranilate phosphoribosyltransferase [Balneolaceae bacterium]MBO6647569.1 anthranilate phosphoribosyltransferase [Balneolaceae bacterium]